MTSCEIRTFFHRGDPNSSGTTDISDAISIFGFLFLGDAAPTCKESADTNNDGTIDISDGISLLNWLFLGGPQPAAPGPAMAPCESTHLDRHLQDVFDPVVKVVEQGSDTRENSGDSVVVHYGKGAGNFLEPAPFLIGEPTKGYSDMVIADIDRDGFQDIVVLSQPRNHVFVTRGNAVSTFSGGVLVFWRPNRQVFRGLLRIERLDIMARGFEL